MLRVLLCVIAARYQVAAMQYRREVVLWSFWFDIWSRLLTVSCAIAVFIAGQGFVADLIAKPLAVSPSMVGVCLSYKLVVMHLGLPRVPHSGIRPALLILAPFIFGLNVIMPKFGFTQLPDFGAWFFLFEAIGSFVRDQVESDLGKSKYQKARDSLLDLQFDSDFALYLATEDRLTTLFCYQDLVDFECTLSAPRAKSWFLQYVALEAPLGVPSVQKFCSDLDTIRVYGHHVEALHFAKDALADELARAGSRYMKEREMHHQFAYGKLLADQFSQMGSYPEWVSKLCSSCFSDPAAREATLY